MTLIQAKAVIMPCGVHKDRKLCEIPLPYLKWLAKNWIKKDVRDAAAMVVNLRSKEVGQESLNFNPTYQPQPIRRLKPEKVDFSKGAFPELQSLLDRTPEGLF